MKSTTVVAIDLGGTKLSGALLTAEGTLLLRKSRLLEGSAGGKVGELISELVRELLQSAGDTALGVGVCVPGISSIETGTVWAPNIPGWERYPLLEELSEVARGTSVTIRIDSDRACSILGEVWLGAARGARHAVFMAVGTGIGAGILVDGGVLRGAHDIAGAIGWMALSQPFREEYAACGDFEYHASGEGLARVAREYVTADPAYRGDLRIGEPGSITAQRVFAAYESGDPVAERVIGTAIAYWGKATANLVSLFNPEKILYGGGVFGPATRFLGEIRREASRWAQPISMTRVALEASALGSDAALYGAGYLALRRPSPS